MISLVRASCPHWLQTAAASATNFGKVLQMPPATNLRQSRIFIAIAQ
jgi:hypothetical protein